MSKATHDAVRASKNPQEALLAIATALDLLIDHVVALEQSSKITASSDTEWGNWDQGVQFEPKTLEQLESDAAAYLERVAADRHDVVFSAPSPAKQEHRRVFEQQQLKLATTLRDVDSGVDWTEAYVQGGPMWLYIGNRDLVMTYPESTRRAMVEDVLEDDPQQAHLMSIDILKQPAQEPDLEGGSGALAIANVGAKR